MKYSLDIKAFSDPNSVISRFREIAIILYVDTVLGLDLSTRIHNRKLVYHNQDHCVLLRFWSKLCIGLNDEEAILFSDWYTTKINPSYYELGLFFLFTETTPKVYYRYMKRKTLKDVYEYKTKRVCLSTLPQKIVDKFFLRMKPYLIGVDMRRLYEVYN